MSSTTRRTTRRSLLLSAPPLALILAGARAPFASAAPREAKPVTVNGRTYDAYTPAATKLGQFAQYTCEFDAAWVILKTFDIDVSLEEQVDIVGVDRRVEPYAVATAGGYVIYGGDITKGFSGDYGFNFLARTSGKAMRKLFAAYDLRVKAVRDRVSLERALRAGNLIWIKATVDFLAWEPATWVTPEGNEIGTVFSNDHAVVVIGYNEAGVVIRDVLGPTSTNWSRPDEYFVPWDAFLAVWGAQGFDGLAVAPPTKERD